MDQRATHLTATADLLTHHGLHTGDHFADRHGRLTISAATYRAVTGNLPPAFHTDDDTAISLIAHHPDVMAALSWLSIWVEAASYISPPTDPATGEYDHISHVDRWTTDKPLIGNQPPTEAEVVEHIRYAARLAHQLDADPVADLIPHQRAA